MDWPESVYQNRTTAVCTEANDGAGTAATEEWYTSVL